MHNPHCSSIKLTCLALLLAGCVNRQKIPPQRVSHYTVIFKDDVSIDEKSFALFAVNYIAQCFRKDFGYAPRPITIIIEHALRVYYGQESIDSPFGRLKTGGKSAIGYYSPSKNQITLIAGRYDHLPALYHEFCHANEAPNDADHLDNRWDQWQHRAREISQELISKWFDTH